MFGKWPEITSSLTKRYGTDAITAMRNSTPISESGVIVQIRDRWWNEQPRVTEEKRALPPDLLLSSRTPHTPIEMNRPAYFHHEFHR